MSSLSLSNKLKYIFGQGIFISLSNVVRCIDGEWCDIIVWEHKDALERTLQKCNRKGFTDIETCVDDCIKYIISFNQLKR